MVGSSVSTKSNKAHSSQFAQPFTRGDSDTQRQSFHEGLPQYDEDGFISWLNCKRFQTKMNLKSQKFLERGSLFHVLLGLHSPTLRGKNEAFVLDKRGLHQPYPTGFKWQRDFMSP
jgi:hypothetical protein